MVADQVILFDQIGMSTNLYDKGSDLAHHIWRICWIWRVALRVPCFSVTLFFNFIIYNKHVTVEGVCGALPARVLPEAQEAGSGNAFQRSSVPLQQDGARSGCDEYSNSEG